MTAPTHCPPLGISLPVWVANARDIRDGDTVEVHVRGGALKWAVRLIDCWCPEVNSGTEEQKKIGRAARAYVQQVLESSGSDLRWFVPFDKIAGGIKDVNLLNYLTFDRVPGYLFIGPTQTLNRMLVDAGLASTKKGGELGR